ncbi:MAG: FAD-dependent oxidoreductase [Bacteroidia bacterium]|nr:FAD-dependent oxidoreductase [Bacteroidia bacterium]
MKRGAAIHVNEKVLRWKKDGDTIILATDKETYRCSKLIITSGAWTNKMVPALAQTIKITRQLMAWIKPKNPGDFSLNKFPCWMIADDESSGMYYGFPVLPIETFGKPGGLKLAYHYPGQETDPDNVDKHINKEEVDILRYGLEKYLPGCFESILSTQTCLYSNTPDENFIIDFLPGYENQVALACGFSGHGFKFVSVVGEILAELILDGKTKQPIEFLSAKRFL